MLAIEQLIFSRTDNPSRSHHFQLSIEQLAINANEFTGLLGPNGAGKSTALHLISKELTASSGSVSLHGTEIEQWPRRELAKHLALLPQASNVALGFTAAEVVAMGATPLSLNWRTLQFLVRRFLKLVDAYPFKDRAFMSLSGGQQQRVQLARVLLQLTQAEQAPLLLLDEPTAAQDIKQQHQVLALAKDHAKQGMMVCAVLHDINHAIQYCDKVAVFNDGQHCMTGSPLEILSEQSIESVWGYRPCRAHLSDGAVRFA
ncbi:MAG: ATP-binding cassette domain-containing protein [Kangiellaceae bacterium]|jgi:iron complex transport system ATP-binding protein|nr:ATP-binding cassette domain-containing protein [Kangiellaceae bacterium]